MTSIVELLEQSTASALTEEDNKLTITKSGPVMATPAVFVGAAGYAWITLQAYDLGREHAGANG